MTWLGKAVRNEAVRNEMAGEWLGRTVRNDMAGEGGSE